MNMKWKLTLRYVLSIAIVAVSVVIINIIALLILFTYNSYNRNNNYDKYYNTEIYVRDFKAYIKDDNGKIYIANQGKEILDKYKLWIQILDEDSKEVYSYNKPEDVKDKHTPIELINGYKYSSGFGGGSDILVSSKDFNKKTYTYLIGFPRGYISKYMLIMDSNSLIKYIKDAISTILIMDFIIAIIFGYIFSKGLTKPVKNIINSVEDLSSGNYEIYYQEKGIYSKVFKKLNNLSDKLKSNEVERMKIEKMREDFIANISHDIKTPLSSIKGYAEILGGEYDFSKDEVSQYADIIDKKANYIKELVDDLNLTMKLKNNNSIVNKKEVNIVELVKNSVIDIFNDPKYSERDIEFICSEKSIINNVDEMLIKRAINNIIYNSLVHNDEDISIVVKVYKDEKTHICIKDNGKGISEDEIKYIFERYYRGTNTGEAHKGSGLGMAIVKEIVNAHNGDINIKSELGAGTEIEITLY